MHWYDYILVFIGLPVLSYLVAKFATVGYLRAKQRERKNHNE